MEIGIFGTSRPLAFPCLDLFNVILHSKSQHFEYNTNLFNSSIPVSKSSSRASHWRSSLELDSKDFTEMKTHYYILETRCRHTSKATDWIYLVKKIVLEYTLIPVKGDASKYELLMLDIWLGPCW